MPNTDTIQSISLTAREHKLIIALVARSRAQYADYLADVKAEWELNGYRAHYCRHGVNMWVDYDCACGRCEDEGTGWYYLTELGMARWEVRAAKLETLKRIDAICAVAELGGDISALIPWAAEKLNRLHSLVE